MSRTRLEASPRRLWAMLSLLWLMNGCAAGRVTPVGPFPFIDPPFKTIALAPNGGIFADVLGMALEGQGYTMIDTGATLAVLLMMQTPPESLLSPEVMASLNERGIDAVLVVRKRDGKDGLPQTAYIRLHRTEPVMDVGGIDWENSWVRRGTLEAVQEIAAAMKPGALSPPHLAAQGP